jgi:hypothetical protein
MSVRSAALQATCAALGFVLTVQSATAALHHAHKQHHRQVISQWRPWDANAAVSHYRSMVDTSNKWRGIGSRRSLVAPANSIPWPVSSA